MKKQMKNGMFALNIILGALLVANNANAQMPQTGEAPHANAVIGNGNVFEKEISPLLREISRKKTVLELRKLERELEKLDEEAMKAQVERDKMLSEVEEKMKNFDKKDEKGSVTPIPFSGNGPILKSGGTGMSPLQFNPVGNPLPMPPVGAGQPQVLNPTAMPVALGTNIATAPKDTKKAEEAEPVYEAPKVFMIYGMENNLHAKIAIGDQGGYVVRKGDTLPDGRLIVDIKPNYLEVKVVATKTKKNVEKIFVTGSPNKAATTASASAQPMPRAVADSIAPPTAVPSNTAPGFVPAGMNVQNQPTPRLDIVAPVPTQRPITR